MPRTEWVRKDNIAAMMLDLAKVLINLGDGQPLLGDTDFTDKAAATFKEISGK